MPSNFKALAGASGGEPIDANFKNVTLLLHGDGSNGAQNNTFLDSSTNNFTITRNGNTTQGSFSPYGSNWSNYFDGSGDYARIASSQAALQFGTGDFTVEGWVFSSNGTGTFQHILTGGTSWSTGSGGVFWYYNSGSPTLGCAWNQVTPNPAIQSGTLAVNTWHHFAVVRSGNTLTLYINGSSVGTLSVTGISLAVNNQSQTNIGGGGWDNDFAGYVSNLRVLKGTALYTSNFTPSTTPLTAITNTSLLTCADNRFRDASTNNFTITRNGDVKVTNFAPFVPSAAYSTSANGGSAYFDGTGDYLQTPSDTAFTFSGSLTIEFWINFSSTPSNYVGLVSGTTANTQLFITTKIDGTGLRFGLTGVAEYATGSQTWVAGAWYHVALVRNGTDVRFYVNGVNVTDGTATNSTSYSGAFLLGGNVPGTVAFPGYISNLRIVKGTAVYTAAFTPPTAPVTAITNTSLLLNATNAAIFDNSMKNDLETVGNAQISTSVKKFGTGSMAFDGGGDRLSMPATAENRINVDGNFTIEFWAYFNSVASNQRLIAWDDNSTNFVIALYTNTSGNLAYYLSSNGVNWNIAQAISMGSISINTWYHIALVRNGSTFTPYINGVAGTTTTSSATLATSGFPFIIGDTGNGVSPFNGYIDDFRITKGIARYTANFTAPTAPFPNK